MELTGSAAGSELYQYPKGRIGPLIVGCVTYQILQDNRIHQTAFAYRLERKGGLFIWIEEGDLRGSDVVVSAASGGFIT